MKLVALGVDYRSAPASVREALAFDGPKCAEALDALTRTYSGAEFVVLSTCNRVELYAAGDPLLTPEADFSALSSTSHRPSGERAAGEKPPVFSKTVRCA